MPDPYLAVPVAAEDVTSVLWTPTEITYLQSWIVEPYEGFRTEEGDRTFKHEFMLNFMGETEIFGVLGEESASEAQIEDMAATVANRSMERIKLKLQERGNKIIPQDLALAENALHRSDLAGAWRDMRRHAGKRRASSNGRIYYPVAKI